MYLLDLKGKETLLNLAKLLLTYISLLLLCCLKCVHVFLWRWKEEMGFLSVGYFLNLARQVPHLTNILINNFLITSITFFFFFLFCSLQFLLKAEEGNSLERQDSWKMGIISFPGCYLLALWLCKSPGDPHKVSALNAAVSIIT